VDFEGAGRRVGRGHLNGNPVFYRSCFLGRAAEAGCGGTGEEALGGFDEGEVDHAAIQRKGAGTLGLVGLEGLHKAVGRGNGGGSGGESLLDRGDLGRVDDLFAGIAIVIGSIILIPKMHGNTFQNVTPTPTITIIPTATTYGDVYVSNGSLSCVRENDPIVVKGSVKANSEKVVRNVVIMGWLCKAPGCHPKGLQPQCVIKSIYDIARNGCTTPTVTVRPAPTEIISNSIFLDAVAPGVDFSFQLLLPPQQSQVYCHAKVAGFDK
jgi:hypothetical protein